MQTPQTYNQRRKSIEARLPSVTVGGEHGMFKGNDHFAIQGAVDYVARQGGGTVHLLPGTYKLRNTIALADGVTLQGSGHETRLEKLPSRTTPLAEDSDGCRWFVVAESTEGFAVGDGITLSSGNIDGAEGEQYSLHTITAVEGQRLYLDRMPGMAHWISAKAKAVSIHSLIEARGAAGVTIRDLCLIGNRSQNEEIDGNHGAAIYLRYAEDVDVVNVTITDFHGDAISWQVSHDIRVSGCHIDGMSMLGLHPGTGSQRPIMQGNTIKNCRTGIYWCWDVNNGIAENNHVSHCSEHGIAIGHRDTDNVIARNTVEDCTLTGIFFRPERSAGHTAHRTLVEGNVIKCPSASREAVGISLVRGVEDTVLRNNTIVLRGQGAEKAISIDPTAIGTVQENNEIVTEAV